MWILILTLLTNNGSALTAAEFDTKKACEVAGAGWKEEAKKWGPDVLTNYRCVSKANLPPDHIYNR